MPDEVFTVINPWRWQEPLGYVQAIEVAHGSHTLYCAGQAAIDANGAPAQTGMAGQLTSALDNVETVLKQAGYSLANIVRVNYLTTSIPDFFQHYGDVVARLAKHHCQATSTLVEVSALAMPRLLVEIEVTAVK